jgi:hypothetical protein
MRVVLDDWREAMMYVVIAVAVTTVLVGVHFIWKRWLGPWTKRFSQAMKDAASGN